MSDSDEIKMNDSGIDNDIIDSEEYKRALETLNSKKSDRVRKVRDKKTVKEGKKDTSAKKSDPVIPVCIILAFFVLFGSLFYFLLPLMMNPAMDFTYEEFKERFENTAEYHDLLSNFGFDLGGVKYTNNSESSLSFKITDKSSYLDYFEKNINPQFGVAIQGQARKFDGKLTFIRAIAEFDDRISNVNVMSHYFSTVFNALYRDRSSQQCYELATQLLTNFKKSEIDYTVDGKYAYRIIYGADTSSNIGFIGLEIIPSSAV